MGHLVKGRVMNKQTSRSDDKICCVAQAILREAERTARSHFRERLAVGLKDDLSPVTVADLEIERNARDLLQVEFPDHDVLGEEFGSGGSNADHLWVIDPIDGTRSFISGHPLFGFLLAYLVNGKSRFSAVSMPALGERFLARAGGAATLNGMRISVSDTRELSRATLYINEGEKIFSSEPEIFRKLLGAAQTSRFAYDCYPHALLAAGSVDAVVDYDLKPFDFLPVAGLVEAAGGIMTDWHGEALSLSSDGRVVSAATPALHQQLLELLKPVEPATASRT